MAIAYQRRDDETLDNAWTAVRDKLVTAVKDWIRADADYFELQRMQGRASYDSTGHTWTMSDEDDPDLSDKEGNVVLLRGVDPVGLADQMIAAAREHCAEKGSRTHYQVVAFTEDKDSQMQVLGRPFKMGAQLFDEIIAKPNPKDDGIEAVSQVNTVLVGNFKEVTAMFVKVLAMYPDAMSKLADAVHDVSDVAKKDDHSIDKLLALLNFRREEQQDRYDHERYLADKERRARVFSEVMGAFGPEVARTVFGLLRQYGFDVGGDVGDDGSELARRLEAVWLKLNDAQVAQLRDTVPADVLAIIDAARAAPTDAAFRAQFAKLHGVIRDLPADERKALLPTLAGILGGPAMLELGRLLKETEPTGP